MAKNAKAPVPPRNVVPKPSRKRSATTDAVLQELRSLGLKYPGAHLKSPWPGHMDLAVKDKTFAYLSIEGEPFSIGCKLPTSGSLALTLPFTEPTGYGLGKSGWVTAKPTAEQIDIEMLKSWIDESYRAQAPKKLVKELDQQKESSEADARKSKEKVVPPSRKI